MDVIFTDHAIDRWCERFAGEDLAAAVGRAKPVSAVKLIRENLATGRTSLFRTDAGSVYLRDEVTGCLFACRYAPDGLLVVTLYGYPRPSRQRARDKSFGRRRPAPELEASEW